MRARVLLTVAVCAALALTGCGKSVTSGTVIDKRYEAARDWTTQEPTYMTVPVQRVKTSCNTVNKQTKCSTYTTTDYEYRMVGWHTEYHHKDQQWVLTLKDSEGDTGEVTVDQTTYDRMERGSQYGTDFS